MIVQDSLLNLKSGQVHSLSRRLEVLPDPVKLYAQLSDGGQRRDTLLLESADAREKTPKRSIIVHQAALRITARGHSTQQSVQNVRLEALTPNGCAALDSARHHFTECRRPIDIPDYLEVEYDRAPEDACADERLKYPSVLDPLRILSRGFRMNSGTIAGSFLCAGVFSYDLVDAFERLPEPHTDPLEFPNYLFWLAESLVIIDHRRRRTDVVTHVFGAQDSKKTVQNYYDASRGFHKVVNACQETQVATPRPSQIGVHQGLSSKKKSQDLSIKAVEDVVDLKDAEFADVVTTLKEHVRGGDVFQIVPSRSFKRPCPRPLESYLELRRINPSPYMFFISAPDLQLFGASPESALCVTKDTSNQFRVSIRPIAGTRARGRDTDGQLDLDLDNRIEIELRLHKKEIAEHMMLIDLARNDVASVSKPGTRCLNELLTVERYSHVMHLVSNVTGQLRADLDALHVYQATLNMGTLVGAPKLKAAQLLRTAERSKRGPYGGAVGYITHEGELDTAIVIRSAWVRDGYAEIRAGAGVVADSVPELEAEETRRKAQAVIDAIERTAEATTLTKVQGACQ